MVDNAPPEEADAEDLELMSGADGGGGGEDDDTPDAFHNVLDPIVGHKMAGKMPTRSLTVCSACTDTRQAPALSQGFQERTSDLY